MNGNTPPPRNEIFNLVNNESSSSSFLIASSKSRIVILTLLKSLDDIDAKLITSSNRSISLYGNTKSKIKNVFIYFIFNDDSYAIKIGRAANVEKRLQSLQTSSPVTLQVLKTIPVGSLKQAQEVEKFLHAKFSHLRISGEWFRATSQLREYIAACEASYFQSAVSNEALPRRSVRLSEL